MNRPYDYQLHICEKMKVLFVDNLFTRNLSCRLSIRCSNPPQGEMKLDCRDSAFL